MQTKRAQNAANGEFRFTKTRLAVGLRPNPLGGAYIALPGPLAGFRWDWEGRNEMQGRGGITGRGGEGWRGCIGREGRVGMGKGGICPPTFWLLPPPVGPIYDL